MEEQRKRIYILLNEEGNIFEVYSDQEKVDLMILTPASPSADGTIPGKLQRAIIEEASSEESLTLFERVVAEEQA